MTNWKLDIGCGLLSNFQSPTSHLYGEGVVRNDYNNYSG